jgi:hypothetical protein
MQTVDLEMGPLEDIEPIEGVNECRRRTNSPPDKIDVKISDFDLEHLVANHNKHYLAGGKQKLEEYRSKRDQDVLSKLNSSEGLARRIKKAKERLEQAENAMVDLHNNFMPDLNPDTEGILKLGKLQQIKKECIHEINLMKRSQNLRYYKQSSQSCLVGCLSVSYDAVAAVGYSIVDSFLFTYIAICYAFTTRSPEKISSAIFNSESKLVKHVNSMLKHDSPCLESLCNFLLKIVTSLKYRLLVVIFIILFGIGALFTCTYFVFMPAFIGLHSTIQDMKPTTIPVPVSKGISFNH